jgi:signal transduction histidine kinase
VLAFISSTISHSFSTEDLNLAEALALRAALSIENARLYRTAQRAVQARDEVLGIVAHDLRSPLNSIVLEADLLKYRPAEPEDRFKSAAAIHRSAMRMNRLVQDLLDIAQVEAGALKLSRDRVSARQVLNDSLAAHGALAAASSVELCLAPALDVPYVWADRDRLLQVFENLICNAIKFTGAGGCVTLGALPLDDEVLFSVADTGRGINPEHLEHIFDRFWQARNGEHRGAGLGLAIVKGIVEAHGGRAWAVSTPGRGATFFFTIPARPREPVGG